MCYYTTALNFSIPQEKSFIVDICIEQLIKSLNCSKKAVISTIDIDLHIEKPTIKITSSSIENFVFFRFRRSDIIIINLKNDNLKNILTKIELKSMFNPRAYFIIIINHLKAQIFKQASLFFINKLLIFETKSGKIFSYRPYQYENANWPNTDYFHLTTCNDDQLLIKKLNFDFDNLPKKWRNTTIIALNNIVPPYCLSPKEGIEIENFNAMAKHLQAKVNYTRDSFTYWGRKKGNNYSFIYGQLQRREGDMGIGVFHSKFDEHLDFDMSFTYMEDASQWLAPKARILPYWKRLGLIFKLEIYLSIFLCLVFVMILCRFLYRQSLTYTAFVVCEILLESSTPHLPLQLRSLMAVWISFCLIISTMFKSKLIDTISKNSYEYQIDSVEDIASSNLQILIDHDIATFYNHHTHPSEEFIQKNYKYCENPRICITRTAFVQDCITVDFERSNQFFSYAFLDNEGNALTHMFKKPIFPVHIHLFFVRGYPLFQEIDRLLTIMRSSGIIDHLYDTAEHNAKMTLNHKTYFKVEVLGLKQMQIAFFVWGIGVFVSIVVFVAEEIRKCSFQITFKSVV